jgi:hypothetical protein
MFNNYVKLIQQTGGLTKILAFFQDSSEEPENHQLAGAAARVIARSARKRIAILSFSAYFFLVG